MNIVVVLPCANTEWFDICFEVTLTMGLWLHTGCNTWTTKELSVQFIHVQLDGQVDA